MGLHLVQLLPLQAAQPRDSVGVTAALKLVESGQLPGVARHDQLAAAFVRDLSLVAEVVELACPRDAQLSLQRAGSIVDAPVDYATVVAGLVAGDLGLPLEDSGTQPGVAAC